MEEKLNPLFCIDKGESVKKICDELEVGKQTVSDRKKHRKEIEDFSLKMVAKDRLGNRATIKTAKNSQLDVALFIWSIQERENGVPISGAILQSKALILNEKLRGDLTLTTSSGWLDR